MTELIGQNRFPEKNVYQFKESKALAETVNIPKFFHRVIPLSEKEAESVFTHQENGDLRVRDDYINLILGHYEVEQSLKKKESLRGFSNSKARRKEHPA